MAGLTELRRTKLGTIENGKLADLVVLNGGYFQCSEPDILKLSVEQTSVCGKTVFPK